MAVAQEELREYAAGLRKADLDSLYDNKNAKEAVGEVFCTTDKCELPGNVIASKEQ